ncbi:MAG: AbrB/MazE/SpoVT family DNA-binding domain-containing protein [Firmicutes bacterium]|nr:AbrB/MazE/SpoVT family DNA-binding domain-containing protein [Bacillota bacterium]
MKYTGVIRRVDDLGRLVIPKEFRKMQKIKAGDPLEICLIEDGDMIIRRVDLSAKLVNVGKNMVSELHSTLQLDVFLCDAEKFLFVKSDKLKDIVDTPISGDLSYSIQKRKDFASETNVPHINESRYCYSYPIYTEDLYGSLVILSLEKIPDYKLKIVQMLSRIIASNLHSF